MGLKEEMQSAQHLMAEAFSLRDASRASALYCEDACLMADGMPTFRGRTAIGGFFEGAIGQGVMAARFTTEEVDGDGTQALEMGSYALYAGLPNGERICVDQGRYFVAWRKMDGAWRIYRDMFNRSTPLPQSAE